jgi:hypothetical protein
MGYCVAPTGLWDRGCGWSGSALGRVVVGGWLVRGEILRVAQNDKADGVEFFICPGSDVISRHQAQGVAAANIASNGWNYTAETFGRRYYATGFLRRLMIRATTDPIMTMAVTDANVAVSATGTFEEAGYSGCSTRVMPCANATSSEGEPAGLRYEQLSVRRG